MLTINQLIDYCGLKPEFIFASNDYELYAAILYCFDEFMDQDQTGGDNE